MKKTNYKILLIFALIITVFFVNKSNALAQDNTLLPSDVVKESCINVCSKACEEKFNLKDVIDRCKDNCKLSCENPYYMNETANYCIDKCNSNNALSESGRSDCINTCNSYKEYAIDNDDIYTNNDDIYTEVENFEVNCEDYTLVHYIWNFIIIVAPFLTIIFCGLDLIRMLVASSMEDNKKHKKNLMIRLVALVALIVVPTLTYVLLTTFGFGNNQYLETMRCIVVGK